MKRSSQSSITDFFGKRSTLTTTGAPHLLALNESNASVVSHENTPDLNSTNSALLHFSTTQQSHLTPISTHSHEELAPVEEKFEEHASYSDSGSRSNVQSPRPNPTDSLPTKRGNTGPAGTTSKSVWVEQYPFILITSEGYWCRICKNAYEAGKLPGHTVHSNSKGAWFARPISKEKNAHKLGEKAEKHQISATHKQVALSMTTKPINKKINELSKNTDDETGIMRENMAAASYFLFKEEIPHTTNWRPLINTISLIDNEFGNWFQARGSNAHYLSSTTATDWLEASGRAVKLTVQLKVANSVEKFCAFSFMADECTDENGHEMLSHCVRYLNEEGKPVDAFLDLEKVESTTAEYVSSRVIQELETRGLDTSKMIHCGFDGAANFSGVRGGVQALLRKKCNANLTYTHCKGHLLQLALVRAAESSVDIKRTISTVSSLFSFFHMRPKRLHVLETIEKALQLNFKLVQPGKTRWLSHERSLSTVLKVLQPLLLALEDIHQTGADLSSEAGGLLLDLRSEKTITILLFISHLLQPLASLNNAIQASATTIVHLCPTMEGTFRSIEEISLEKVKSLAETKVDELRKANIVIVPIQVQEIQQLKNHLKKYKETIFENFKYRLLDSTRPLIAFYNSLQDKEESIAWNIVLPAIGLPASSERVENLQSEWKIMRRMPNDLASTEFLSSLISQPHLSVMFPAMRQVSVHVLLLPLTTAAVERSFSTMNRVLCPKRSRLLSDHLNDLMSISIEGPEIPDVRRQVNSEGEADVAQLEFRSFIKEIVKEYNMKPRRI